MFFPAIPAQVEAPPAQAPLQLDLKGALDRARTENPMIRAARARVDERQGLITTTRADALPQVTLGGNFTRSQDPSILIGGFKDIATILGSLVPGGQSFNPGSMVMPRNVYSSQATLEQPLFHWGKIGTAIEIAEMGAVEAKAAYGTAELDVLHGVAKAYLGVLSAQAELEVVAVRRKTAERFVADVKARLEAQTATELDRLRAESEFLSVLPETLQAEAAHKRALEQLNGALGMDPRTPVQVGDLGTPTLPDSVPAGQERTEIQQYRQQEAMLKANDKIITSDLRPKLDFSGTYGTLAGRGDEMFKSLHNQWRVSVNLKFPVFDGMRSSGKRAQNRAQLEQVRQMRLDKERAIAVERSSAERELEKAKALKDAATQAHATSVEALRVSRESFDQGLITSLDLLQAERMERQMESQRRRAELGLWAALFDLRRSAGLPPLG